MKNYYKILQVESNASYEEIRKSYRKLVKKYHPDQTRGDAAKEEIFKEINEAYSVLSDETKRAEHDKRFFNDTVNSENEIKYNSNGEKKKAGFQFDGTGNIFEDFFGFDPNKSEKTVNFKDKTVQPMKTKDAFNKIFGKGRFK